MITTDAASIEARYAKQPVAPAQGEPPPLYAPSVPPTADELRFASRQAMADPNKNTSQIPQGQPIPEGVVISQVVGRGQPAPSIMVVPPQQPGAGPAPQMAIVPPSGAGRTTIGTFVERPGPVSPTVSNPLTAAPQQPPSGTVEPPAEAQAPKPERKPLDLAQAILDHVHELGGEKSEATQKFYDRSEQTIKGWLRNPGAITLECINKFLARRPGIRDVLLDMLEPHFKAGDTWTESLPNRGKTNACVCAAILDRPTLPFLWTCIYLAKKYELGFQVVSDTVIHRSRNVLAQRFLQSGAEWSLWLDSDMAAPIANPDYFRWLTGSTVISDDLHRFDVLQKLLAHSKPVVGGVYSSRRFRGPLVVQPDVHPRSHEDKILCNDLRKGLPRGSVEVDWIGFGCAVVHRSVFLEVQRSFPDLAPMTEFAPWRFFQPMADEGEDEAFCKRVRQCAIPIILDTELVCGHIGSMAFLPEHTAAVAAA